MQQRDEESHELSDTNPQKHDESAGDVEQAVELPLHTDSPILGPIAGPHWPIADLPKPAVIDETSSLIWNAEAPQAANYIALGRRLARFGDLYRSPQHGGGLLLASPCRAISPLPITKGTRLAPIIVDRLIVTVIKNAKLAGSQIPNQQLDVMLASEVFLQQFPPLDAVVTTATYLNDFELTDPGYNDGGLGQRIYYVGKPAMVETKPDAVNRFLDAMAFASNADRTNAVAAGLTVLLKNHWPGAKPIILATATKSHAGKDTVISFATGNAGSVSVSYQATDWALERSVVGAIKTTPNAAVIGIDNARLDRREQYIASAFIERFATDPAPFLFSTGTGSPVRVTNNYVLAISTNFGLVSNDIMNRALPIHLEPVGDVHRRESAIGNPKLEYLPANRERIEAELRGMIEDWKAEGQPLDETVQHAFSLWARTVGGILRTAGFEDFLGNYSLRQTEDDPLRRALGILGAERPDRWLQAAEWAELACSLGLVKTLVPVADRDSVRGHARGIGVVLSAHIDETFVSQTENEKMTFQLNKVRRRFAAGEQATTRYKFEVLSHEAIPEDAEPCDEDQPAR
jgi:hypothetical protein